MARFSVFEEALLVIEAQNPNVEWYTKVTAAIPLSNPAPTMSSMTQEPPPRYHRVVFVKRVDRRESSKEPEPVSSTSV